MFAVDGCKDKSCRPWLTAPIAGAKAGSTLVIDLGRPYKIYKAVIYNANQGAVSAKDVRQATLSSSAFGDRFTEVMPVELSFPRGVNPNPPNIFILPPANPSTTARFWRVQLNTFWSDSIDAGLEEVELWGHPDLQDTQVYKDCVDASAQRVNQVSGYYKVSLKTSNVFTVYCDMETDHGGWMLVASDSGDGRLSQAIPSDTITFAEGLSQTNQKFPDQFYQDLASLGPYQVMVEEHNGPDADLDLVAIYRLPASVALSFSGKPVGIDTVDWHVGGHKYRPVINSKRIGVSVIGDDWLGIPSGHRCTVKGNFEQTAGSFGAYTLDSPTWSEAGKRVKCNNDVIDAVEGVSKENCLRLCEQSPGCGFAVHFSNSRTCSLHPTEGCEPLVTASGDATTYRLGGGGATKCTHAKPGLGVKHWVRVNPCPLDSYQVRGGAIQCVADKSEFPEVTDNALTFVSEPHPLPTPPPEDLALQSQGSIPFASGSNPDSCSDPEAGLGSNSDTTGSHCFKNINDGEYGNTHSWQPGAGTVHGKRFVGVRLGRQSWVNKIAVGRKHPRQQCCNDGFSGIYELQYTVSPYPDHNTPEDQWTRVGFYTLENAGRHAFALKKPVFATALRIVVPEATSCIDEFEIYGTQPQIEAGKGLIRVTAASFGENCASDLKNNALARMSLLCNDLPSCEYKVLAAKFGHPAPGCHKELNVTFVCGQTEPKTLKIGQGCSSTGGGVGRVCQDADGQVMHLVCQDSTQNAVTEPETAAKDESDPCESPTPTPTPTPVSPNALIAEGIDPIPQPAFDDWALQSNGGIPFASGSGQVCSNLEAGTGVRSTDFGNHCFRNINDGIYGNDNSWTPGSNLVGWRRFVGVRFAQSLTVDRIAVGRNGLGVGCCNSNYTGEFEVQYTMEADADHQTPSAKWFFVGKFKFSNMKRHVFRLQTPVWATAIRVLPPYEGSVLDELEVYGYPTSLNFQDPVTFRDDSIHSSPALKSGRIDLSNTWSISAEISLTDVSSTQRQVAFSFGGNEKECATTNVGIVFAEAVNDETFRLCVTDNQPKTVPLCSNSDLQPDEPKRLRIMFDGSNKNKTKLSLFVDGSLQASRPQGLQISPQQNLAVSFLSSCHNFAQSTLEGSVGNLIVAQANRLANSVEAWVPQPSLGCSDFTKTIRLANIAVSECKRICVEDFGGCNDGFVFKASSDECFIPRDSRGCEPVSAEQSTYFTPLRGDASTLTIKGFVRREGLQSVSGAGSIHLQYSGVSAIGCKAKCDAVPNCGMFVFRQASTVSMKPENCWLFEKTDFALAAMASVSGYDLFVRDPKAKVCVPEPLFKDVPACGAFGRFDGIPTRRDRATGGFAGVFSALDQNGAVLDQARVCAAMGMVYQNGPSHTTSTRNMRYIWYSMDHSDYCGVPVGQPNQRDGVVIETDEVTNMCLVRAVSPQQQTNEKYYDRLSCSCGDDAHSAMLARLHAGVLAQATQAASPLTPDVWFTFGPSGVLGAQSKLYSLIRTETFLDVNYHQWMGETLGAGDFSGEGYIVANVGIDQPLLTRFEGAMTIGAWLWVNEIVPDTGVIIKDTTGAFGTRLALDSQGHAAWTVQDASGNFRSAVGQSVIPRNKWVHLSGVFEEECLALYVNGTLANKNCDLGGHQGRLVFSGMPEILIGRDAQSDTRAFKGSMADVRVYGRALNDDEIRTMMREALPTPQPLRPPSPSLL
eukprot:c32168_g1_i1.p1 GENE.c32168_g1_i1~~c32168_g1_i1.p1  ORF type:complete len:1992 (-),score=316.80 c32168_g1_i1:56-5161(-)